MSSTIILTPEIREIPYFSSFSIEEKEVVIPRPMMNESINYKTLYPNLEDIPLDTLISTIENRIYLNLDTEELILELIWILGETEEKMKSISKLPFSIQTELRPYLLKHNSVYIYGIRCKVLFGSEVTSCTDIVTRCGNLRLLKWARKEMGLVVSEITSQEAARNGYLDVLKYLHEIGCSWNKYACRTAAENGHLDVLKYLHENGCPWTHEVYLYAARSGYIDILEYALKNKCPIYKYNDSMCLWASQGGHLHVIKWAIENGFSCEGFVMDNAASQGHLDVVKWLHKKRYDWDDSTCSEAAFNNRLEVVKYLHENGCPWDAWTSAYAIVYEYNELLDYLRENDCPEDEFTTTYVYNNKDIIRLSSNSP